MVASDSEEVEVDVRITADARHLGLAASLPHVVDSGVRADGVVLGNPFAPLVVGRAG